MSNGRVVIVEDDKLLLKNSMDLLRHEGFYVDGAASARSFFHAISNYTYDVAIVDINLPDMSGYKIVEYLRSQTEMGLIVMTARSTISDKIKGYDSGADYYFVKPVDIRELISAIKNLMARFGLSSDGKWKFDSITRLLVSPKGVEIELTVKEQNFVEFIFLEAGVPVTRGKILEELGYSVEGEHGNRALDVLVVRLRKKIKEATDEDAPIKTVHAYGFTFKE